MREHSENPNDLEKILTQEEKDFLSKIKDKYQTYLNDFYRSNIETIQKEIDSSGPEPFNEAEPPRNITGYQREMIIKVISEVTTIDESGRLTAVEAVTEDSYHIPVPAEVDFNNLLKQFFDKFDPEITNLAKKITNVSATQ
jgi:hypothetical protein